MAHMSTTEKLKHPVTAVKEMMGKGSSSDTTGHTTSDTHTTTGHHISGHHTTGLKHNEPGVIARYEVPATGVTQVSPITSTNEEQLMDNQLMGGTPTVGTTAGTGARPVFSETAGAPVTGAHVGHHHGHHTGEAVAGAAVGAGALGAGAYEAEKHHGQHHGHHTGAGAVAGAAGADVNNALHGGRHHGTGLAGAAGTDVNNALHGGHHHGAGLGHTATTGMTDATRRVEGDATRGVDAARRDL